MHICSNLELSTYYVVLCSDIILILSEVAPLIHSRSVHTIQHVTSDIIVDMGSSSLVGQRKLCLIEHNVVDNTLRNTSLLGGHGKSSTTSYLLST